MTTSPTPPTNCRAAAPDQGRGRPGTAARDPQLSLPGRPKPGSTGRDERAFCGVGATRGDTGMIRLTDTNCHLPATSVALAMMNLQAQIQGLTAPARQAVAQRALLAALLIQRGH